MDYERRQNQVVRKETVESGFSCLPVPGKLKVEL